MVSGGNIVDYSKSLKVVGTLRVPSIAVGVCNPSLKVVGTLRVP